MWSWATPWGLAPPDNAGTRIRTLARVRHFECSTFEYSFKTVSRGGRNRPTLTRPLSLRDPSSPSPPLMHQRKNGWQNVKGLL